MNECQVCGLDENTVTLKIVNVPEDNPNSTKTQKVTVCTYCAPKYLGVVEQPPQTPTQ